MFKKLLSNLPFNPSLIGQVSFYSKRMRAEGSIRKLGFSFLILSLLVQGFAAIAPSEPSLAYSSNDIIPGGIRSKADAVNWCRTNLEIKTIFAHYGVSCEAVDRSSTVTRNTRDFNGKMKSLGRNPYGKPGEERVQIGAKAFYLRYVWGWGNYNFTALQGTRANGATFLIMYDCGNIIIIDEPPAPPEPPETPPPPPPVKPDKIVQCDLLSISTGNKATVEVGTEVRVRGRATGKNSEGVPLTNRSAATMYYEYVDAANGRVIGKKAVPNVRFSNGVARDGTARGFVVNKPGHYYFRLAVKYDNKGTILTASGSNRGDCVKQVFVEVGKPCEEAESQDDLLACLELHKRARNETQNIADANGTKAEAGDIILYTLSVKNTSKDTAVKGFVVEENVADILEYADIIDLYGGTLGDDNIVRWPAADIKPGETLEQRLKVRIKDPIPQTPVSASNPGTFDLTLTNVYGDTVNIDVEGELPKTVEMTTKELPNTGPGETLAVAFVITVGAGYFFARTRLMTKELDIVKSEYAAGGTSS